jgi:hypothetical protein
LEKLLGETGRHGSPGASGSLKAIDAYAGKIKAVSAGTAASSTTLDMPTADGGYDIAFVDAVNPISGVMSGIWKWQGRQERSGYRQSL